MIQQPGCTRPSCSPIGSLHPTRDDPEMDQAMPNEHISNDLEEISSVIWREISSRSSLHYLAYSIRTINPPISSPVCPGFMRCVRMWQWKG